MAQSLDEFVAEIQQDIITFRREYIENNKEAPEMYPLKMKTGQEGLWFEFFMNHVQDGD